MNPAFAPRLLGRVEDAGINASAPREQLWVDGWLVRFSPGKAKRARCVQAVAAGRLSLDERLARCLAVYADVGLQPCFRITPFSLPVGLDEQLAARGMERIDDTRVMAASLDADASPALIERGDTPEAMSFRAVGGDAFAEWIGLQRGSSAEARAAHAERIRHSPVRHRALYVLDPGGLPMAGGQVVVEGDRRPLRHLQHRGDAWRGIARALCRQLLGSQSADGARVAYLQVEASNAPARRSTSASASPTPTPITTVRRRRLSRAPLEAGALVDAEVDVHALDRGTAGTLARLSSRAIATGSRCRRRTARRGCCRCRPLGRVAAVGSSPRRSQPCGTRCIRAGSPTIVSASRSVNVDGASTAAAARSERRVANLRHHEVRSPDSLWNHGRS
jgi:hypothetical protein